MITLPDFGMGYVSVPLWQVLLGGLAGLLLGIKVLRELPWKR